MLYIGVMANQANGSEENPRTITDIGNLDAICPIVDFPSQPYIYTRRPRVYLSFNDILI